MFFTQMAVWKMQIGSPVEAEEEIETELAIVWRILLLLVSAFKWIQSDDVEQARKEQCKYDVSKTLDFYTPSLFVTVTLTQPLLTTVSFWATPSADFVCKGPQRREDWWWFKRGAICKMGEEEWGNNLPWGDRSEWQANFSQVTTRPWNCSFRLSVVSCSVASKTAHKPADQAHQRNVTFTTWMCNFQAWCNDIWVDSEYFQEPSFPLEQVQ